MDKLPSSKQRILQSAAELFWKQGYANTGVAQILRESNTKSGSLYYFFPTKEDLLIAVLENYKLRLIPEVVQPVFDRVSDPLERVFGILDGYRQMLVATGFKSGCPIGNLALEMSDAHPRIRELVAENFSSWKKVIEDCLAEAKDCLGDEISPERLASFILTVMEGGIMQARTYEKIEPYEEAIEQLREYFEQIKDKATNW